MEKINADDYRISAKISLKDRPTKVDLQATEAQIEKKLAKVRGKLSAMQDVMYAYKKYAVLTCFQGMDTSGKDSLIREVFRDFNPRGVVVQTFKTPNSAELEHDYLWRHYVALPERGKFAVFNRSHYENVLISRVHPEYVLHENIPGIEAIEDIPKNFWKKRLEEINHFEEHLVNNGTIVLKFFLHLSKEEQRERLLRRLEEEKHNWKFSPDDLKERECWEAYQEFYEEAINATSGQETPWFIVPADDKATARLIVVKIIRQEMKKYHDIKEPELSEEIQERIRFYKKQLEEK
ncbi:MAG: phosphate--nucleotide phosphotransferase [Flavobacterium sp. BFFFF1]|uniref:PPK2 family polyphosphate kinase n=1 Tax=Flavobacterium sp. BFFFF1 TaxID=2015557 RepID=UPI000BCEB450|nr:PPK2 family polyphosphate kinase [Flavobacterium sp. BFFFF1]OYU82049.1 MAG: phosphate--nucleotide phosphotransferase [Flavobacterium sp. BFFFF1]